MKNILKLLSISLFVSSYDLSAQTTICTGTSIPTCVPSSLTGSWTSGNPTVASVDAGGTIYGISAGTANISLTNPTYLCGSLSFIESVNVEAPLASPTISGASSVCVGDNTTLSSSGTSVTWATSDASIATVTSGGVVTGIATGSVVITASVSNSCGTISSTFSISVLTVPSPGLITGTWSSFPNVCNGSVHSLDESVSGGTWSSSNTAIATVASSGSSTCSITSTSTIGSVTISYAVSNSCGTRYATIDLLNESSIIQPISLTSLCPGASGTLSTTPSGGNWTVVSSPAYLTLVPSTGAVTATTTGNTTVSYSVTNSCGLLTRNFNVRTKAYPSIYTNVGICLSSGLAVPVTLNPSTGGVFSIATSGIVSASSTGTITSPVTLTGVSVGTAVLSYSVITETSDFCAGTATRGLTVVSSPPTPTIVSPSSSSVSGTSFTFDGNRGSACSGNPTWTSSNPAAISFTGSPTNSGGHSTQVANITSFTGTVNITFTYNLGVGCVGSVVKTLTYGAMREATHTTKSNSGFSSNSQLVNNSNEAKFENSVDMNMKSDFFESNHSSDLHNIKVSPNPTYGKIRVELPVSEAMSKILISKADGQLIESKITNESKAEFDLSMFSPGIYNIQVTSGSNVYNEVFIIK